MALDSIRNDDELRLNLTSLDGKGYMAYKNISGKYHYKREGFTLSIDHVQSDPFASPSRLRIIINRDKFGFPKKIDCNRSRRIGFCDFITRRFAKAIYHFTQGHRGSGKSGRISIDSPHQEILDRTSVIATDTDIEVRFTVGLPAYGRNIAAQEALAIFFDEIPILVEETLLYENFDVSLLLEYIEVNEDADYLRSELKNLGLVSFIANQSMLPRMSGIDDRPSDSESVVPFVSPISYEVSVNVPNAGKIWGMGIPEGVTVIVGGGFHGKSTLLKAIELGVYNHRPGDGRERVVTRKDAMKIKAEEGRWVHHVDISSFIHHLPQKMNTECFSTPNASGSTSQATNIVEALESGTDLLILDEDSSATNFMIRDGQMERLVPRQKEPITPFIQHVRNLYDQLNCSTILVMGGSGDYFSQADHVICMEEYNAMDVTIQAHDIAQTGPAIVKASKPKQFFNSRIPSPLILEGFKHKGARKVKPISKTKILFGTNEVDLTHLDQMVSESQLRSISDSLIYALKYLDGKRSLNQIADLIITDLETKGLNILGPQGIGSYAMFRKQELMAAFNRLKGIKYTYDSE
ncbi:ABC-ATPase domain-containing protein [Halosquirtibacter laminarini]|uniref:ABC-ATPase domain-containing protein n=1 Tax=Halosquirtibacter laminarini TaxID=3374600 RepID=A0AC61NJJ3_9BACT|nr:ABC-ATPase domain-containing protein [Prolixibacteraceae bacterium]